MPPISLRLTFSLPLLALLALLCWPRVAFGNHHHIGGGSSSGSSGSDDDADCLVWGYAVADGGSADRGDGANGDGEAADAADAADTDASAGDAANDADAAQPTDAGTADGGSNVPAGAVLVCLEHAKLFGCDCATVPPVGNGWSVTAIVAGGAMLFAWRRRRPGPGPGPRPRPRPRLDFGAGDNR